MEREEEVKGECISRCVAAHSKLYLVVSYHSVPVLETNSLQKVPDIRSSTKLTLTLTQDAAC